MLLLNKKTGYCARTDISLPEQFRQLIQHFKQNAQKNLLVVGVYVIITDGKNTEPTKSGTLNKL